MTSDPEQLRREVEALNARDRARVRRRRSCPRDLGACGGPDAFDGYQGGCVYAGFRPSDRLFSAASDGPGRRTFRDRYRSTGGPNPIGAMFRWDIDDANAQAPLQQARGAIAGVASLVAVLDYLDHGARLELTGYLLVAHMPGEREDVHMVLDQDDLAELRALAGARST